MNEMKFSVLVVDDEYHICENICSKVKMMNMKEIGEVKTCYSGEEALEICRDYKPEIVITDIKMEGMDGIEMIRQMKKILFPVCFIVLSGYDDYKYVREAFQEGVTDYLLKPILTKQLHDMLQQQCECLLNKTSYSGESRSLRVTTAEKIFEQLSRPLDKTTLDKLKKEIPSETDDWKICIVKIGFERSMSEQDINKIINLIYDLEYDKKEYQCLCSARTRQKIELLLSSDDMDYDVLLIYGKQLIEEIISKGLGMPAIGISSCGGISEIYRLNYECENNLCYRMTEGYGKLFSQKEQKKSMEIRERLRKSTSNLIENPKLMLHTNIWKRIEVEIRMLQISELKRYYNFVTGLIYSAISSSDKEKLEVDTDSISFYDITSIEHFVEVVKRKILVYVDFMERKESQGNIMDEICEYIDQNFTEKLVLSDIAEKFFISYSHLSKMFHETYGVSFQEYLISKRMVYSEQLLQCPTMNLQEISEAVGYNNVFNFSRAFKKYYGVSPTFYKKAGKNETNT